MTTPSEMPWPDEDMHEDAWAAACPACAGEYMRRELLFHRTWTLAENAALDKAEADGRRLVSVDVVQGYTPPRVKGYSVSDFRTRELIETRTGVGDEDLEPALDQLWSANNFADHEAVISIAEDETPGGILPDDPDYSDLCLNRLAVDGLRDLVGHQAIDVPLIAAISGWDEGEVCAALELPYIEGRAA